MNQKQLLMYLNQVSFALTEAVLFLDTHPNDKKAMEYYQEMKSLRQDAIKKYEREYGPLTNDSVDSEKWEWVMTPWPWEV